MNFGSLVKLVHSADLINEFLVAFSRIAHDEQDSVRIQAISICITLADMLSSDQRVGQESAFELGRISYRTYLFFDSHSLIADLHDAVLT
jgi:hypothetical protein